MLEAVAAADDGIGVSEIAATVGFDKGTVSRLLGTLRSRGYVHQRTDRRFEIGSRVDWLAGRYRGRIEVVRAAAEGHARDLCARTRETVHVAVREGLDVVYVAQEQPDRAVRVDSAVGTRLPLRRTAMGRAMLAALGPREREALLAALRQDAVVAGDGFDEAELLSDVAAAARRGWAAVDRHDDVTRLAAAITGPLGDPVAALALSGPAYRVEPELAAYAAAVVATAEAISADLARQS